MIKMIVPGYNMIKGVRINERAKACSDNQRDAVQSAGRDREVGWGREEYPEHRVRDRMGLRMSWRRLQFFVILCFHGGEGLHALFVCDVNLTSCGTYIFTY